MLIAGLLNLDGGGCLRCLQVVRDVMSSGNIVLAGSHLSFQTEIQTHSADHPMKLIEWIFENPARESKEFDYLTDL